jgi:RNase P/RNase MRP subunit POP5
MIYCLQRHCENIFNAPCNTYGIFLTRFKDTNGIVRCFHIEKMRTIQLLSSISMIKDKNVEIKTLGTSGTMKALIRKHLGGDTLQDNKRKDI